MNNYTVNKIIYFFIFIAAFISCSRKSDHPFTSNSGIYLKFEDAANWNPDWPDKNVLVVHSLSEPDNLHPTNGNSIPRAEIFFYTQRTLFYYDFEKQKIIPGLIKSMPDVSADGLTYKYTLRNDITWDDGSPVTSGDILFTAKAFKCPLTNDPAVKFYWNNIADILPANDTFSFTIRMKKKHIQNISFLTGFSILERKFFDPGNILNNFSLEQFGDTAFSAKDQPRLVEWAKEFNDDKYGRDPEKMNGLGMYKVSEWSTGQSITLIKKKNHWSENSGDYHEKSFPEKIIFKINKDDASQQLDFKNQLIDVSNLVSTSTLVKLNSMDDIRNNYNIAMMPTYNFTYVAFNEKPDGIARKKLFDDLNVRKAVSHLIPVDQMIRLVYGPFASSCKKMAGNVSLFKDEHDNSIKPVEFNKAQAVQLLDSAGWKDTDGDGILDKVTDNEKISLTADLFYLSTVSEWKDMASLISEECIKAGIKINPVGMDLKSFIEKAKSHDFDLLLGSWSASSFPEDYTQLYHSSSWNDHGSNYTGFGNSATDSLITSINSSLTDEERIKYSHKLQQAINNDIPYVYLYSSMRRNIIHKRFGNQVIFCERPGILFNMLRILQAGTANASVDVTP
jgi:peptide/nickel transport system substrate-binding protein